MPSINERMLRRSSEDIQYIGDLVEKHFIRSEFGAVMHALTQGRISEEVLNQKNGVPAERVLGRIEMAAKLVVDLEQYVADRDTARRPIKRKKKGKLSVLAEEPEVPDSGGQYGGAV